MFLGREIPRKGILGRFGLHGRQGHARKGESGLRRARRHRAVHDGAGRLDVRRAAAADRHRPLPSAWANKIVFLDEPTAALGVVQTKNVLDTIKRVRDKGIAVVLISHSMPARARGGRPRSRCMRLGTRVATLPAEGTTVEELVGAMTGALDAKQRRSAHERHRPDEDRGRRRSRRGPAVAAQADRRACSRCGSSASCSVIVAFFTVAAGSKFLSGQQLLADLPERRRLGGARASG